MLIGTVQFVKRHGTRSDVDLSRLLVGRIETASARATELVRTLADAQALDLRTSPCVQTLTICEHSYDPSSRSWTGSRTVIRLCWTLPISPVYVNADGERFQRVVNTRAVYPRLLGDQGA